MVFDASYLKPGSLIFWTPKFTRPGRDPLGISYVVTNVQFGVGGTQVFYLRIKHSNGQVIHQMISSAELNYYILEEELFVCTL